MMIWSYSRVKTFEDCPYKWYLKYILYPEETGKKLFFANYGKLMHDILAQYYTKALSGEEAQDEYLRLFKSHVLCGRPPNAKVLENYFISGLNYLQNIQPIGSGNILCVEKKIEFDIGEIDAVVLWTCAWKVKTECM